MTDLARKNTIWLARRHAGQYRVAAVGVLKPELAFVRSGLRAEFKALYLRHYRAAAKENDLFSSPDWMDEEKAKRWGV